MNTRRRLLVALGTSLVVWAWPLASGAQKTTKPARIGFLSLADESLLDQFKQGLSELGYVEGRDFVLEPRVAGGKAERLPGLAAELVQLKVDVILAASTAGVRTLQQATTTIPIVMATSIDPVGSGLVASLARPGRNITGLSSMASDLNQKHVELAVTTVPKLSRVAVLTNPANSAHREILRNIQAAAEKTRIKVSSVEAETPEKIASAFAGMAQARAGAVIVATDAFFRQHRRQIAELALRYRLATVFADRQYVEAGGLMSYGQSLAESFKRAAYYVDKILKGAKPADLPVEQAMRFELVINLKTAKALGLTIPQIILIRADQVIQ